MTERLGRSSPPNDYVGLTKRHGDERITMETESTAGYFLSPQQNYLWMLQQRLSASLITQITSLVEGKVDETRLRDAFIKVIARQEILRTVFRRQAGMKTPFQVILDFSDPEWKTDVVSPDGVEQGESSIYPPTEVNFNFDNGPLLRVRLANLAELKYKLTVTASSLCADTSSLTTLLREVFTHYDGRGDSLAPAPLRYIQFAQWQTELLDSEEDAAVEGKSFWTRRAESGEQQVNLPFEMRPEAPGRMDRFAFPTDPATLKQIKDLVASTGTSVNDVLLAAWQSLLFRFTGSLRLAVGVVQAGREYEELVDAVGPIEKMLPIHARFEGNLRFREILIQTREALVEAIGCQEYLDPAKAFTSGPAIGFSCKELPETQRIGTIGYTILNQEGTAAPLKLELNCVEDQSGLRLEYHYDSSRYDAGDIERISQSYMTLLMAAIENPDLEVARLKLLTDDQRVMQLYGWNQTEARYPNETIHALLEKQAERTPERFAVRCGERAISYAQLNQRANQLAHYLRKLGVRPNSLVGLCLDRSVEMMVAVLAILKAGGAYVSLSADYPGVRLAQQLQGAVALITEDKLFGRMPAGFGTEPAGPILRIDSDAHQWTQEPEDNPEPGATSEDLVYGIYTSGSTGTPKCVGVKHRNLVNYACAIGQQLKLASIPDGLQFATVSTLGADLGNTCIYPALLSGGTLHVIPYEVATDAQQMAIYQVKHPIDVLKIVPSHLAALLNSPNGVGLLPRKYLITGGEILTRNLVEQVTATGAACQIINHYGPTETTVGSLTQPLSGYDWKNRCTASIPIGKPIANTCVYVLDQYLQPVPESVIGELYISGAGVSAGYLGRPDLTAERFLSNPFVIGDTMYRTGDLSRYVPDGYGTVEFLGRADNQVKIRGFRVELGEIEAALMAQPGVKQVVVLAREDMGAGDNQLIGYVVVATNVQMTSDSLRSQLKQQLPDYMVPSVVVLMGKLPLTPNGKIDRNALPRPEDVAVPKTYIAPSTPTEIVIAKIWGDVLQRQQISLDDNFFELGGHSLMATQVVSRIREHFAVALALRTMFELPILKTFSQSVDSAKGEVTTLDGPIQRVARTAYRMAAKIEPK
jgi:amino acid adenylation domain-containing protein